MNIKIWSMALIATAVVAFAACGGDDAPAQQSAGDSIVHLLTLVDKGQWGPEWDLLHPSQQAIVSRDTYITCAQKAALPSIDSSKVIETYPENVAIPGTTEHVDSTAVTVEMHLRQGTATNTTKQTFHAVSVNGQWRWILSDPAPYAGGKCP